LQRRSIESQVGFVQVPAPALQSAAVAQGPPMFVQPLWSALQDWGWVPLQRVSPGVHAEQVPFPLQSAADAQAEPMLVHPF